MTSTTATAHTAAVDLVQGDDLRTEYVPACTGCDWTGEQTAHEDDAQAAAAAHVDAAPYVAVDPWTGLAIPGAMRSVPLLPGSAAARAAASESCTCGGDLCGVCMRDRHQGNRGPLTRTELFGAGRARPTLWAGVNAAADAGELLPPF